MADSRVTVDRFSWPDLMPCLLIFRSLPTALSMTVLVTALFAVAATPIGWFVMEKVCVNEEMLMDQSFEKTVEVNRSPWKVVYLDPGDPGQQSIMTVLGNQLRGVELVFNAGVNSIQGLFSFQPGLRRFFYFLGGAVWTLLVWSFFGGAITRAAMMRYTRDEPIGIDDAFDFAFDKFFSCFGGVAIPLLAVFGLTIPIAGIGLLMATNFGAAIGGALWFVVLILSLIIAVILLGLMFAWPLIVSSISCEGQDSFDGMSRAYAYVFQRPVHYLLYGTVAVIFSGVCWLVAGNLINGTIQTAHWASSWGMNVSDGFRSGEFSEGKEIAESPGAETVQSAEDFMEAAKQQATLGHEPKVRTDNNTPDLISEQTPEVTSETGTLAFGKRMIKFWNDVARTLGAAFLFGLFWSVAAAVYLLLRKDLDDTELDEIYMVDERRTYELPPLKDDVSGVPQVDEDEVLPAKVDPPSPAGESSDGSDSES